MGTKRRKFSSAFKAKVAMEAIKEGGKFGGIGQTFRRKSELSVVMETGSGRKNGEFIWERRKKNNCMNTKYEK